ncbi:MAG: type II secretion system ATPase GspE [Deltaproteobacteria bacterium]|nr:type II secretion system ATPase GspE [Deltaproteobacteria bacterium]MBW2534100.1 type II secretion system ATPase GspE [Deltaproteobacteria bacterium]
MHPAAQQYLAEVLVRRGVVPAEQLATLLQTAQERGQPLTDVVVAAEAADEERIAQAIAEEWGVAYTAQIDVGAVPLQVTERVPITYAKQHKLLVLGEDERQVYCAVSDPLNTTAIDDVRTLFGKPVELCVTSGRTVLDAINRVWERKEDAGTDLEGDHGDDDDQLVDILDSDDDAPIIAWVNSLFSQAVRERASDIHIEPEDRDVVVRYRIDGELYVAKRASKQFMSAIVARVKIMAQLNIAEKRLPQDGRITLKIAGKSVDIRVSTIPTSRAFERIVMRLLHKSTVLYGLDELGFQEREFGMMAELIKRPNGIILVTGPTGSGKTTTLYACLNRINEPSRNILTAEDPVEYEIAGIHQVHVNPSINLTFASALRAFLRQDPDVIMVGEIRDKITADIAIHASLTGHLVLSTIHTNDSAGAVTRLVDMGVESFLVRSSIIAILAQRLVRVLCPHCKEAYRPSEHELEQIGLAPARVERRIRRNILPQYRVHGAVYRHLGEGLEDPVFYRAKGCAQCLNKGFTGRIGVYELLVVGDEVGRLILANADAQSIKRAALAEGLDTMRDDGARKVIEGRTTVEEVLAATQEDVVVE